MVAGTGVGIQSVTVPLFIRDRVALDERALAIAAALVAQTLPAALLALVGGTLADRIERRRILVCTYGVAATVSCCYVALAGLDVRSIWPVFPLGAVIGSSVAFTNPARQSMLPMIVSRGQLQNGVIFGTMGFMATLQFLGPSVAGLMVDLRGLTSAFSLEVLLLALGALLFSRVRSEQPAHSGATVLADLLSGLRYVRRESAVLGLLLLGTVIGIFFIGPFAVTVPIMVPDVLHASDLWVGLLWGCFGGGVFLGSVALTLRRVPRRGLAVCLSIVVAGALQIVYGRSEQLWLSGVIQVASGLSASVFMNYVMALLQENTAPAMMGRVMSMYTLAFFISMPIGYMQSGLVTRSFGPQATLVGSGAVALVLGVLCVAALRPVRELR